MTKELLILVTAIGLHAQTSNFQPPGLSTASHASHADNVWRPDGQSGPYLNRPFSGTEIRRTTQTLADGTHVENSDTSLFFRDGQGRMRNESSKRAQIYDPVAGYSYTLELANKTYEKQARQNPEGTYFMAVMGSWIVSGGNDTPAKRDPYAKEEQLQAQMVNGVYCRGSRVTHIIPEGTFGNDRDVKAVNERWYSDDLKLLVKSINSDPRFGVSTYDLINIVQGPPDPALFQIPTDFTNVQRHGTH